MAYDCRGLSDCVSHQHGVKLAGVWDLMTGDTAFLTHAVYHGLLPRYTGSQAKLLIDYLGIADSHLDTISAHYGKILIILFLHE